MGLGHLLQQIKAGALLAAFGLGLLVLLTALGFAFAHHTTAIGFKGVDAFLFELLVLLFSQICVRKEWPKNNYFKSI